MTSTPPRPEHAESKIHFGRRVRRLTDILGIQPGKRACDDAIVGSFVSLEQWLPTTGEGRSAEVTVALGPQRQLQTYK